MAAAARRHVTGHQAPKLCNALRPGFPRGSKPRLQGEQQAAAALLRVARAVRQTADDLAQVKRRAFGTLLQCRRLQARGSEEDRLGQRGQIVSRQRGRVAGEVGRAGRLPWRRRCGVEFARNARKSEQQRLARLAHHHLRRPDRTMPQAAFVQHLQGLQQSLYHALQPSQARRFGARAAMLFEAHSVDQWHHAVQRAVRRNHAEHTHQGRMLERGQRVGFVHESDAGHRGGDRVAHIAGPHAAVRQAQHPAAGHELLQHPRGAVGGIARQVDEAVGALRQHLQHGVRLDLRPDGQRRCGVGRRASQIRETNARRHAEPTLV